MDIMDINLLLSSASATDGRTYDEAARYGFLEVLHYLDYEVAREALVEVKKDASVRWLEPRHIAEAAKPILARRDRDRRVLEQSRPKPPPPEPMTDEFRAELAAITEAAAQEARLARLERVVASESMAAVDIERRNAARAELDELRANMVGNSQTV